MKQVYMYQNHEGRAPIIYLNVVEGDGSDVWEECRKLELPPVMLAVISGLAWDEELSPWEAPPVFREDRFTGGANGYLKELTSEIIPDVHKKLGDTPSWSGLAGYSLAGLFSVYAAYETDLFRGIVSASGSFWYPDFVEYMRAHSPGKQLSCAYFSLGNKERKVRNKTMTTVLENTKAAEEILEAQGVRTVFETNPGNHFTEPALRTAKGIAWLLKNV